MSMSYTNEMIQIIETKYPNSNNEDLAMELGISQSALRTKASRLGIKKSDKYMNEVYKRMNKYRKIQQESNYKKYQMNNIQKNIIIGSLLGDGSLSLYGNSRNACYRENTGASQIEYRKWKAEILKDLDFKIKKNGAIYSPSHPIYTELYRIFYPNASKILPREGLAMLDHPIALACLFMDDGSLITSGDGGTNKITISPGISLYTQSFTRQENIILQKHIDNVFGIKFNLCKIPSGSGYHLKLYKNNEVRNFINIIRPYVDDIPSMKYKIDIDKKLYASQIKYSLKYPHKTIRVANKITVDISYSKDDELKIAHMLQNDYSIKEIATTLDRSYYGMYDKIRRMRKKGQI